MDNKDKAKYLKNKIEENNNNQEFLDRLLKLSQEQTQAEELYNKKMDVFWNNLSAEEKESAFYCIINKLYKAEIIDNEKSYKKVLQNYFDLNPELHIAHLSNFLDLRNHILSQTEKKEYSSLQRKEQKNIEQLKEKFRIKTKCSSCGYQSMDIYPEQNLMCPTIDCEGKMIEH
jgi:hypothetical protein